MPTVYVRADPKYRTRFHRDARCRHLTKRSQSGTNHPLVAIDLEEAQGRPCLHCYPDAPRVEIHKAYCPVCASNYACQHNGGIQIIDRGGRTYWTWPDSNSCRWFRQQTTPA